MLEFIRDLFTFLLTTSYTALNIYTYFVFVGLLCIDQERIDSVYFIIIFIVYHVLLGISLIMYLRIQSSDDISTKDLFPKARLETRDTLDTTNCNPFFASEMIEKITKNLRVCPICDTFKPPRAHHCSKCGKCYLKYDHHCFLLGTCIVFQRYKFFYQFLFYNSILVIFTVYVYIHQILRRDNDTIYMVHYIVNVALLGPLIIYYITLLVFHTLLILNNETTVEFYALNSFILGDNSHNDVFQEGPVINRSNSRNKKYLNPYNIGKFKNWCEVFGDNWIEWFLPTYTTKGDGISFPKKNVESSDIDV
eukprot:jgi/Antlo1/2253/409